jgi:hypothetical protein
MPSGIPLIDRELSEDLDEAPDGELEQAEEAVVDQATAARTIAELQTEIATLRSLEALALEVRESGTDTKWRELASLLGEIFTPAALDGIRDRGAPYGSGVIARPVASHHHRPPRHPGRHRRSHRDHRLQRRPRAHACACDPVTCGCDPVRRALPGAGRSFRGTRAAVCRGGCHGHPVEAGARRRCARLPGGIGRGRP